MEAGWHFVSASAFVVVGIHIDRARPVFGGGRLNEKLTTPGIDLDFIYGAVKKLDLDSAVVFVNRDNLEECPVRATKPFADCREGDCHLRDSLT